MSTLVSPDSVQEALELVHAGLAYLAAADATQLAAEEQARCLRELEQATAVLTAARSFMLGAFTSGQGVRRTAIRSQTSRRRHCPRRDTAGHSPD